MGFGLRASAFGSLKQPEAPWWKFLARPLVTYAGMGSFALLRMTSWPGATLGRKLEPDARKLKADSRRSDCRSSQPRR